MGGTISRLPQPGRTSIVEGQIEVGVDATLLLKTREEDCAFILRIESSPENDNFQSIAIRPSSKYKVCDMNFIYLFMYLFTI